MTSPNEIREQKISNPSSLSTSLSSRNSTRAVSSTASIRNSSPAATSNMLSSQRGAAAVPDLLSWAQAIAKGADPNVDTQIEFEDDSHTFILRLAKGSKSGTAAAPRWL